MIRAQVYEGTSEHLVKELLKLPGDRKYRMMVIPEDAERTINPPKIITFGMFPLLQALTEEDFKSAEWRGEELVL